MKLSKTKKGFSLIELIIVIIIIGILSGAAYIGIQKAKVRSMNDKVLDDLIAISNSLEQYKRDHFDSYPVPAKGGNMNLNCFYADATYAHDCDTAAFMQGMIDNDLLTKRYLSEVPTDPRTGSRYVYGVSRDGRYFEVAGIVQDSDGSWNAKTVNNLGKGYHLPSLIRAYDGPNFVVNDGDNLPYSPDHLAITATLQNVNGEVAVDGVPPTGIVYPGQTITTGAGGSVDIYFSDGSITHLTEASVLEIKTDSKVEENDSDNLITKIRIKLLSGKIWNKVARLASSSEFNVETTTAIAGVRGTEFGLDENNRLVVLSGEVVGRGLIPGEDTALFNPDDTGLSSTGLIASDAPKSYNITGSGLTQITTDTPELILNEIEGYYTKNLNNNISPRILKIKSPPLTANVNITIANINTYYDVPEGDGFIVDYIKAYEYSDNEEPVYTGFICPVAGTEDYTCDITSLAGKTVVFRFEYGENYKSGFSIPVDIKSGETMTEQEIYGAEGEEDETADDTGTCAINLLYPANDTSVTEVPSSYSWSLSGDCDEALIEEYTFELDGTFENVPETTYTPSAADLIAGSHEWKVTALPTTLGIPVAEATFELIDLEGDCTNGSSQIVTVPDVIDNGTCVKNLICTDSHWPTEPEIAAISCDISCNAGYQLDGDGTSCALCPAGSNPPNSHPISGCDVWACDEHYKKVGDACEPTCGDDYVVAGEEVCDGTIGCIDSGLANQCTCDIGYTALTGGGCESTCTGTPAIVLTSPTDLNNIPYTSANFIWTVYPPCAFVSPTFNFKIQIGVTTPVCQANGITAFTKTCILAPDTTYNLTIETHDKDTNLVTKNAIIKTMAVAGYCGDGIIQTALDEECDGGVGANSCASVMSGTGGTLACTSCHFDKTDCLTLSQRCAAGGGFYDGTSCWKAATAYTQSCTSVCSGMSLVCSTDTNWTVTEPICIGVGYGWGTATWGTVYSPIVDAVGKCKNDTDTSRECGQPAATPYKRICKCNY